MSCKAALYAANTNAQTVSTGGVVNFGSIVRRYGNNANISGGNVVVSGSGYYDIDANITFTAAAGTVVISLYKDGVPIPGASASFTTAASTVYSVTIPAIVRQVCACMDATITAVVTGVAAEITNAAVTVEKI